MCSYVFKLNRVLSFAAFKEPDRIVHLLINLFISSIKILVVSV